MATKAYDPEKVSQLMVLIRELNLEPGTHGKLTIFYQDSKPCRFEKIESGILVTNN